MQKELLMTIGVPFSGKSSLANQYAADGWEIIERDTILQEILRSDEFLNRLRAALLEQPDGVTEEQLFALKNALCIRMLSDEVKKRVHNSENERFFYDGTNLQKSSRAGILELQNEGCCVSAVVLPITREELHARMEAAHASGERDGAFNEQAFAGMAKILSLLEEPTSDEGFSELRVVSPVLAETVQEMQPNLLLRLR